MKLNSNNFRKISLMRNNEIIGNAGEEYADEMMNEEIQRGKTKITAKNVTREKHNW